MKKIRAGKYEHKGFSIVKGAFLNMWYIINPPDEMEPSRTTLKGCKSEIDKYFKLYDSELTEVADVPNHAPMHHIECKVRVR